MIVGGETGMLLPSGEREKEMQKNVESQTIGFGEIWDFRIVPLPAIIAGRFDRKTVKSESRTRPNNTFRLLKFLLIKKQIIRRVIWAFKRIRLSGPRGSFTPDDRVNRWVLSVVNGDWVRDCALLCMCNRVWIVRECVLTITRSRSTFGSAIHCLIGLTVFRVIPFS